MTRKANAISTLAQETMARIVGSQRNRPCRNKKIWKSGGSSEC